MMTDPKSIMTTLIKPHTTGKVIIKVLTGDNVMIQAGHNIVLQLAQLLITGLGSVWSEIT